MKKPLFLFLGGMLLAAGVAAADSAGDGMMTAEEFVASLDFRQGKVVLENEVATLEVPDNFRYLGPADTRRLLEDGWGNPDGSGTLGMLFPAGLDPLGGEGWGVVITFQEDGYVSDGDADNIDYDQLLGQMQESTRAANEQRREHGYDPVELIGWASRPYYDKAAKKLYWAKELSFNGESDHTLNYNVRILGRRGVLVMNAVASMNQLSMVQKDMQQVLGFTNFNPGHRYADFNPSVDKVAAYGIAALVGGKIAAKAGLIAKLGALLLAGKKFIVAILLGGGALVAKLFRRRKIIADPPVTDGSGPVA